MWSITTTFAWTVPSATSLQRTCSPGTSRRFKPSGIGSWTRRRNSGRIAARGRRDGTNGLLPLADNAELTQRQGQAYSQRSESPRFREESLHLGMRAAVDQVL